MLLLQIEKLKLAREVRDQTMGPYLRGPAVTRASWFFETAIMRFVAALHETRHRQAANTLHRYRHLIETAKTERDDGPEVTS